MPIPRAEILFIISLLFAMTASAMPIAKNGKPLATVVVLGDPPQIERKQPPWSDHYAAGVLVEWIQKMTDAELAVVQLADGETFDGPAIYIGSAALQQGLTLDGIECESSEGIRIVAEAKRVLIAGQNYESTVRAACRFLEKLGCRFYLDSTYAERSGWNPDLGKVIPRTNDLTVAPFTHSEKPGLLSRRFWGSGYSKQTLWRVWNGDGGIAMSTAHAWHSYVSRKEYWDEHPEYFAMRHGERIKSEWLCTSNPEVRAIFVHKLLAQAAENPTGSFSISPPDNRGYCMCDDCTAHDDPKHLVASSSSVSMSARFMEFYHHIATRIQAKYPRVTLNFYAYADYTEAPRIGPKAPSNLVAWIAPIRYSRYHSIGSPHSPTRQELKTVIDDWTKSVDKIAYRTYNFNLAESTVPFSKLSVWKHDLPYLKQAGCIAVNMETFTAWGLMTPHLYQSLRLMYAPDLDEEALMADFWANFYGPAAEPMKAYWTLIDTGFSTLPSEAGSFYSLHLVYTPENLKALSDLLAQSATLAAKDPIIAERIKLARKGFKMAEDYIAWRGHVNHGDMTAAKAISDAMYTTSREDQWCLHNKTSEYIRRFLKPISDVGAEHTSAPNRHVSVLPDTWQLAYDPELKGEAAGFANPDFDDSAWTTMRTYSASLSEQKIPEKTTFMWARTTITVPKGLTNPALVFLDLDCNDKDSKLFINGKHIPADLAGIKRRRPGVAHLADYLSPGQNTVALLLDHRKISENSLGGIVRPVLLCDLAPKPAE